MLNQHLHFAALALEKSVMSRGASALVYHALGVTNLLAFADFSGMTQFEIHLLLP